MKVLEITRDENGNLKEIYRLDERTELRYHLVRRDSTSSSNLMCRPELCAIFTLNEWPDYDWAATTGCNERLDFYIK